MLIFDKDYINTNFPRSEVNLVNVPFLDQAPLDLLLPKILGKPSTNTIFTWLSPLTSLPLSQANLADFAEEITKFSPCNFTL